MKATEMIAALQALVDEFGDLEVRSGERSAIAVNYAEDDSPAGHSFEIDCGERP